MRSILNDLSLLAALIPLKTYCFGGGGGGGGARQGVIGPDPCDVHHQKNTKGRKRKQAGKHIIL